MYIVEIPTAAQADAMTKKAMEGKHAAIVKAALACMPDIADKIVLAAKQGDRAVNMALQVPLFGKDFDVFASVIIDSLLANGYKEVRFLGCSYTSTSETKRLVFRWGRP